MKNKRIVGSAIIAFMAAILITTLIFVLEFRQSLRASDSTDEHRPALTLNIRVRIDGISHLVVQGNTARWYHILASAPGRWIEAPTFLNGIEWNSVWPDIPDRRNHNCECFSSTYQGAPVVAEHPPVILEVIQARGQVTIFQQPAKANDYTLIVEFDDVIYPDKTYGDEWYEVNLMTTK